MDVTRDELAGRLGEPRLVVVDVRSQGEYSGAAGYPCDPRQGHIPGALHVDVTEILVASPGRLRELLGDPGDVEVVAYCHSGSRSERAVDALRAAGYAARNYRGSWHEWSRDESLPAES